MAAPAPALAADEKKAHAPVQPQKTIGLLGGVAWSSSAEYYAFVNSETNKRLGGAHSARVVLLSLDLEPYVNALKAGDFNAVRGFIAKGCAQLQNAGAEFIVLCSNTAHIATDHIGRVVPTTPLLHMADCTAAAVKRAGFTKCGFIGTKFAMENASIQLERLRAHGLEVVTPSDAAVRDKLWHVIETELSLNRFTAESKAYFKGVIEQMHKSQGVQCVILGCTEVPLLISQADTAVPLIDTTRVHARTAVDVSLGLESVDALLPPALAAEKAELLKPKKKKAPAPAPAAAAPAAAPAAAAATGQAVAAAPAK